MALTPPGYLRVDLPRPPIARDRIELATATKNDVGIFEEIQLVDGDSKLQGSITGESPSYESVTYDSILTGGHRFTVNDVRQLDISSTQMLAGNDFRPDTDDTFFLGGNSLRWAGIFTMAIQFGDLVADPNTNGEFQLNGADMKVFSGGAVRNLSDIASGGGAPVGEAYVTIGNTAGLSAERALTGTANQIIVTDNGANSTVVLSTPQDIHTGAIPTFAGMGLSGDLNMITNDILNVLSVQQTGTEAAAGFIRLVNTGAINWRNAANNADFGINLNVSNNLEVNTHIDLNTNSLLDVSTLEFGGSDAASGAIRMRNDSFIEWRNAANSADLGFGLNSSDKFIIDADLIASSSTLNLGSSGIAWIDVWANAVRFRNAGIDKGFIFASISEPLIQMESQGDFQIAAAAGSDVLIGDDVTILYLDGGTGGVGIGAAASDIYFTRVGGSFTSGGSSTAAASFNVGNDLTGALGDTSWLTTLTAGASSGSSIITQTASESIASVTTMRLSEPLIVNNLTGGGVITVAATLEIVNAPTEGVNNYAFWVNAGLSRFDGNIIPGADKGSSIGTTSLRWLSLFVENINIYQNSGALVGDIDEGNSQWLRIAGRELGIEYTASNNEHRFGVGDAAILFIGIGATNADMIESGISIRNDGATIHQYHALKHDQVAHGMTSIIETDTFFAMSNGSTGSGGVNLRGLSESETGIKFIAHITTEDTNRSTTANGAFQFDGSTKSGTSAGSMGSNANILVITNDASARWLVDAEGDTHYDGTDGAGAWDDQPDWEVARSIRQNLVPNYRDRFSDLLSQRGVITYNDNGHHFISRKKLDAFTLDTLYQTGEKVYIDHEQRIVELEAEICLLKNS